MDKKIFGIIMLFILWATALPIGMADENSDALHEGLNIVYATQTIKPEEWIWSVELKQNLEIKTIEYNIQEVYNTTASAYPNTLKVMRKGETYKVFAALPDKNTPYIERYFRVSNFRIHTLALRGGNQQNFDVLVPGTGSNSNMSFFTHENRSMAQFLADNNIIAVGIDYPYVIEPYNKSNDYSYLASMNNTAQHTVMIKNTIDFIQNIIGKKDHEIIAHSFGGFPASDYAARYNNTDKKLTGLILLDTAGPLNATTQQELIQTMWNNYNATLAAIAAGETQNFEMVGFAQLSALAQSNPNGDSGVPNTPEVNMTNYEFFIFALYFTSLFPGSEIYTQGLFAQNLTPIEIIYQAALQGSIYPLPISLDMYGIHGNVPGSFQINYGGIRVPVKMLNAELGIGSRGEEMARRITAGGNNNVCFRIIPGYAHGDVLYAPNAEQDIWQQILQSTC